MSGADPRGIAELHAPDLENRLSASPMLRIRCESCGYGASSRRAPERCPACGLAAWVEEGWNPFADLDRDLASGGPNVP
jgi:hypothetical protein